MRRNKQRGILEAATRRLDGLDTSGSSGGGGIGGRAGGRAGSGGMADKLTPDQLRVGMVVKFPDNGGTAMISKLTEAGGEKSTFHVRFVNSLTGRLEKEEHSYYFSYAEFLTLVKSLRSISVVPQRKGEWLVVEGGWRLTDWAISVLRLNGWEVKELTNEQAANA
jgi:hypothetical protein